MNMETTQLRSTLSPAEHTRIAERASEVVPNLSSGALRTVRTKARVTADGDIVIPAADGSILTLDTALRLAREVERQREGQWTSSSAPIPVDANDRWQRMSGESRALHVLATLLVDERESALVKRIARALENPSPASAEVPPGVDL
jgi:hypothetical protein